THDAKQFVLQNTCCSSFMAKCLATSYPHSSQIINSMTLSQLISQHSLYVLTLLVMRLIVKGLVWVVKGYFRLFAHLAPETLITTATTRIAIIQTITPII